MKVDLHCHSKHSDKTVLWIMENIGCSESYTEPELLYKICTEIKGMNAVTITDHDKIDGCLEIAHLPNTFISEEITTRFPENDCTIHILAHNITEKNHKEIQDIRWNIYDLVDYLNEKNIQHTLAHPLWPINGRLNLDLLEKCILLFKFWEFNADQNEVANKNVQLIANSLTEDLINELANKHNLKPKDDQMWIKHFTAGSDDHSSQHLARAYTEIENCSTVKDFFQKAKMGETNIYGKSSTPRNFAYNIYSIVFQFYMKNNLMHKHADKDIFLRFMHKTLNPYVEIKESKFSNLISYLNKKKKIKQDDSLFQVMRKEAHDILDKDESLKRVIKNKKGLSNSNIWFKFMNKISNNMEIDMTNESIDLLKQGKIPKALNSAKDILLLYTVLSPYMIGYGLHSRVRDFSHKAANHFISDYEIPEFKLAHFTDTYYDMNGVAITIQRQKEAALQQGNNYNVLTCCDKVRQEENLKNFEPIFSYENPVYKDQTIFLPPFLKILRYCYEQEFNRFHTATPGGMGLVSLAVSSILNVPIDSTYHTSFPQFAKAITNDTAIEDLTWQYMLWFYNRVNYVYSPSNFIKDELIFKGIPKERIKVYPRGININKFHPSKNNGLLKKYQKEIKFSYFGRLSQEKNIDILIEAFKKLCINKEINQKIHLFIVGNGPFFHELNNMVENYPITFMGYRFGDELESLYAEMDLMVFPSTTDTFGNVIVEAQASGTPVIVTDVGGPQENIIPDETGWIVKGNDIDSLYNKMVEISLNPEMLPIMGKNARKFMEENSFEKAFQYTWDMYQNDYYN